MELFIHSEKREDPELVEVDATSKVRTLLLGSDDKHSAWIEDADDELDPDVSFEAAGVGHRHHVHRGRCKRVKVVVQFNDHDYVDEYGPNATIKKIHRWVTGNDAAHLSPEQRAKHVLAMPGADHYLADGVHIGSLVTVGTCTVTLNLLPRDSFAG